MLNSNYQGQPQVSPLTVSIGVLYRVKMMLYANFGPIIVKREINVFSGFFVPLQPILT